MISDAIANQYSIASVVLNYNSADDVDAILPQLLAQAGVQHSIIVVDNASEPEQVAQLKNVFSQHCPAGIMTTRQNMLHDCQAASPHTCYLVLNDENRGYSAGNNVGAKLAIALNANAVLISNPDMRIDNPSYVSGLAVTLFSDSSFSVVSSRILGIDGEDQNPLREPKFFEEFAWPISAVRRRLGLGGNYIIPVSGDVTITVPKVSGCCLMIRTEFLLESGLLDENVFLYCEEPILSSQVSRAGKKIVFNPALSAVHAHHAEKKGNSSNHMLLFIKSRRYYLTHYSSYGAVKKILMLFSYYILQLIHKRRA